MNDIFSFLFNIRKEREWISLTKEEIYHLWDTNSEKFGNVEEFGRAVERAIQEKNT
jgi:hypothetical protein